MARQFKIEVEDHVFVADLLEDKAPQTCEAFWNALPFEQEMIQVKWSGHVSYALTDIELEVAECSRCYGVCPGDILYNPMFTMRQSIRTKSLLSMALLLWRLLRDSQL